MRNLFLLFVIGLLFAGCRKENPMANLYTCEDLKQGIASDNVLLVKSAITNYIDRLPSNLHTAANLTSLEEYISKQCADVDILCYACVYTYPAQSEIVISVDSAGTLVKRTIDISGHPYEKMRFGNMHK